MILDIALIILLIARPSQQLLLWIVALDIIRHWPWTANAVARQFELDQYCGLTAWLARLALPGWGKEGRVMVRWRDATHDSEDVQDQGNLSGTNEQNERNEPALSAYERGSTPSTAGAAFSLSFEEISAVQAMARHRETVMARGETPTKSGSILAGFGVKRGGTQRYERASAIYDALFGAPVPLTHYPNMSPEQQRAREALGVTKLR